MVVAVGLQARVTLPGASEGFRSWPKWNVQLRVCHVFAAGAAVRHPLVGVSSFKSCHRPSMDCEHVQRDSWGVFSVGFAIEFTSWADNS